MLSISPIIRLKPRIDPYHLQPNRGKDTAKSQELGEMSSDEIGPP